jgi:hypothetical protein
MCLDDAHQVHLVRSFNSSTGKRKLRNINYRHLLCIVQDVLEQQEQNVPGDMAVLNPGDFQMGILVLMLYSFKEENFAKVAKLFDKTVGISGRLSYLEQRQQIKGFWKMCVVGPIMDVELVERQRGRKTQTLATFYTFIYVNIRQATKIKIEAEFDSWE